MDGCVLIEIVEDAVVVLFVSFEEVAQSEDLRERGVFILASEKRSCERGVITRNDRGVALGNSQVCEVRS